MAIMALRQNIRNRRRSVGSCQKTGFLRFQYASSTLLIRSCYAGHDAAAVLLRFCCAWGPTRRPPRRFYYATTAKDFELRLIYDYDDAIAIVLRPKCRSCADTALMLRFGTASIYIGGKSRFSSSWPPAFEQDGQQNSSSGYDAAGNYEPETGQVGWGEPTQEQEGQKVLGPSLVVGRQEALLDILEGAGLAQLGEQELGEHELGMPLLAVQAGWQ